MTKLKSLKMAKENSLLLANKADQECSEAKRALEKYRKSHWPVSAYDKQAHSLYRKWQIKLDAMTSAWEAYYQACEDLEQLQPQ